MQTHTTDYPADKKQLYPLLISQLSALVEGVPHRIANLANASALLMEALDDINWAGFYLMEEGRLVLGPFQGRPACIEIPVGRGVCGTAVAQATSLATALPTRKSSCRFTPAKRSSVYWISTAPFLPALMKKTGRDWLASRGSWKKCWKKICNRCKRKHKAKE